MSYWISLSRCQGHRLCVLYVWSTVLVCIIFYILSMYWISMFCMYDLLCLYVVSFMNYLCLVISMFCLYYLLCLYDACTFYLLCIIYVSNIYVLYVLSTVLVPCLYVLSMYPISMSIIYRSCTILLVYILL